MSAVFLGRDEVLDRPVAVKVLKPGFDDSEVGARFRQEGRTAAKLSHPNIVQVYDAGEDTLDGRNASYIVMEYVPGGDLRRLMDKKGPLPEAELSRIGAEVAAGLTHAHERGIVHRDVKPHNILLDERGRPKITDFGIARALDATVATRTGSYLGTALYSSPEQLKGERVTPKSDVYSLGATLYHAAVGEPPFGGAPMEVATQHVSKDPVPPREWGALVSAAFERVVLDCLVKDPADRPEATDLHARLLQTGASVTATITGVAGLRKIRERLGGPSAPEPSGIPTQTVVFPTRTFRPGPRPMALAVVAVTLLLLVLVAWGAYAMLSSDGERASPPTGPPEAARQENAGGPASKDGSPETSREQQPEHPGPLPPPNQAANAVYNMYVAAATNDFGASWGYLSERYQDEVGTLKDWQERYEPVSYVQFDRSPEVEIEDDEAEVHFEVHETRPEGTKTVAGTWVCVNEGGEWKLDRLIES
jgi:eukaryotic-like serine/threonine-protein kinase